MPPRRVTRSANRAGGRTGGRGGRGGGRGDNDGGDGGGNPDIVAFIAQQLQALIPTIVTQVSNNIINQGNENGNSGGGDDNGNVGNGNGSNNNGGRGSGGNENGNKGSGGNNNNGHGNGCSYKEFMACKPKEFDGKGGALACTRWIERMEAVIDISNCAINQRVKYASCSLTNKALTWWNTQVQSRGREATMGMTWDDFKALLNEEYCPSNEMQKLENEFWNHTMVGANHAAYTDRFHELSKIVPHLVTPESKRIERYIYGLVPQIRGTVAATEPPTIQSAILKAGALTYDMVRNGTLSRSGDKRKEGSESSKRVGGRIDDKKAKVVKGFVAADPGTKEYIGPHPKCTKCNYHNHVSYLVVHVQYAIGSVIMQRIIG